MSIAAGEIYFIGEKDLRTKKFTDYYKVGIVRENLSNLDRDSDHRLREHQTGNPRELFIESVQKTELVELVETLIHKQFAPWGVRGEWMQLNKKQLEKVKAATKVLASEAKSIAANIAKVENLSKVKSEDSMLKPTKKLIQMHQEYLVERAKINECDEIMSKIALALAEALKSKEDELEEPDEVSVKSYAKVQPRKGRAVFDAQAFAAKYPKIYAKYVTPYTVVKPSTTYAGVRGLSVDFKTVDPDFYKTISSFEPLYKKVQSGKAKLQTLHQFNLDLHPIKVEAQWKVLKYDSALKLACGTHSGIDGILKWTRTEKVTEQLDKKGLQEDYPEKVLEFTRVEAPTEAIIVDPKKGY